MDYDPNKPLPLEEQRAFEKCFAVESLYMAAANYSEQSHVILLRRNAVHYIVHVMEKYYNTPKYDAFIPYLAMNYFDRFISANNLPTFGLVSHDIRLLALCCLTIAWKMRVKSFKLEELLSHISEGFDLGMVVGMELYILKGLSWRMRSVTALCFVRYFIPYFSSSRGFNPHSINEIIIQSQGDIRFTRFKPSIIAAASLLAASSFLYSNQLAAFITSLMGCKYLKGEDLLTCIEELVAMCQNKKIVIQSAKGAGAAASSSGQTPPVATTVGPSGSAAAEEPPQSRAAEGSPEPRAAEGSSQSRDGEESPQQRTVAEGSPQPRTPRESLSRRTRRPGKEPVQDIEMTPVKETKGEIKAVSEIEEVKTVSEIEEVKEEKQTEIESVMMKFELQWISDANEDLTIDSPLFRVRPRRVSGGGDDVNSLCSWCTALLVQNCNIS